MKTPIIRYSDKFLNSISWFMTVGGITLWPFIVLREKYANDKRLKKRAAKIINHESIHIKQQQELLVLLFYILYFSEWLLKLPLYGRQAYYKISFEREAYDNDDNLDYLSTRKKYAWIKRIID
jgi:beta-lactamase regulating signal transducer with metallopeptidase domain